MAKELTSLNLYANNDHVVWLFTKKVTSIEVTVFENWDFDPAGDHKSTRIGS